MRIISKFKDYYDGPASYGEADPQDRVYLRKTEEHDTENVFCPEVLDFRTHLFVVRYACGKQVEHSAGTGYVSVCGTMYPFIRFSTFDYEKNKYVETYLWNYEEAISYVKSHGMTEKDLQDWHWHRWSHKLTVHEWVAKFFMDYSKKQVPIKFHETYDTPVLMVKKKTMVVVNPKLSDMDFGKVMHSVTLAQEIDMFLHSALLEHPRPMVEISDKDQIAAKGFDPKWSFRKHKDENTKKRKKKR